MLALLKRHREPLLVLVLLAYPLISLLGSGRRVREPNLLDRGLLGVSAPLPVITARRCPIATNPK